MVSKCVCLFLEGVEHRVNEQFAEEIERPDRKRKTERMESYDSDFIHKEEK